MFNSHKELVFSFKLNGFHPYSPYYIFRNFYEEIRKQGEFTCELKEHPDIKEARLDYVLTVLNPHTKKYLIISYWDDITDVISINNNLKNYHKTAIYSTCGVNVEQQSTCIPISYCSQIKEYEKIASERRMPFKQKNESRPLFRGSIYGNRSMLSLLYPNYFKTNKISYLNYFEEINQNKLCLSLDGRGGISHRDLEIFAAGTALVRPKIEQKFQNELIPDFHYFCVDRIKDSKKQFELILQKFNSIKFDNERLEQIASNGLKWYEENGTIDANVSVLKKTVNFNKLL